MIYLASDHRGYRLKEKIKAWLNEWGYQYEDVGAFEYNQEDDYPDFIHKAAKKVSENSEQNKAIILGGSGQGEAMVANRYKGVRAAVFYSPAFAKASVGKDSDEMVKMFREHNNANVLSLAASFLSEEIAEKAIKLWLETPFPGEERHIRRIKKLELRS